MRVNTLVWVGIIVLVTTFASQKVSAQSQDAESPPGSDSSGPLREGAYFAPLAQYVQSVDGSRLGAGFGGEALIGIRHDFYAMETGPVFERISGKGHDAKLVGGTINGLVFPFKSFSGLYGTIGFGAFDTTGYPTYTNHFAITTVEGGAGYLWPVQVGNYEFAVRTEGLYRYGKRDNRPNAARTDIDVPRNFGDLLLNVGLQLPLSKRPPPPAPPEPVQVTPAPADTDGDGVLDDQDKCPDTPHGTPVDSVGCPLPSPPPPCKAPEAGERVSLAGCGTGDVIVLRGVTFEFDKARLTLNARAILDNVSDELIARPEINVELSGHTDSKGSDAYNQRLSENRAASVVDYLKSRGVSGSRMTSVGYGETQPVADNATDEGRELNRRVELKIINSDAPAAASRTPGSPAQTMGPEQPLPAVDESKSLQVD